MTSTTTDQRKIFVSVKHTSLSKSYEPKKVYNVCHCYNKQFETNVIIFNNSEDLNHIF